MLSTVKKKVGYLPEKSSGFIKVGYRACVWPTNHPSVDVSNTKHVTTTKVVAIEGKSFETENTVYIPE